MTQGVLKVPMQPVFLRLAAGVSLAALPILSWLPADDMVRTELLSGQLEHFFAYMASGLLLAAAVPRLRPRRHLLRVAGLRP